MSNGEKLSYFLNKAKKLGDNNSNNKIRVAILSSFTINGLEESLRVKLHEKKNRLHNICRWIQPI